MGSSNLSGLIDSSRWLDRHKERARQVALMRKKTCAICKADYTPKRGEKATRNWCHRPVCEYEHERRMHAVVNERRKQKRAGGKSTT